MQSIRARFCLRSSIVLFATLIVIPLPGAAIETREKKPTPGVPSPKVTRTGEEAPVARSLQPFFSQSGPLVLAVDALGTTLPFGTVEVNKPDGGTVEAVFLVATTGGHDGSEIGDGDVQVDGRSVLWDQSIPNVIGGWNALADVTDLLRSKLDSAGPGRISVEVSEKNSDLIDGVVLAAVFSVADDATSQDVRLYFGSHGPSGNGFTIELSQPADVANTQYNLGVGISYGLQTTKDTKQYTVIDVNGRRLTGSAGGPDDGSPSVGALITVGGLEDNSANPPDAVATPVNLASDDEYYDLTPFVRAGDTRIEVSTANPSKDDNLFFASFATRRAPPAGVSHVSATNAFIGAGATAGAASVAVSGAVVPGQPVEQLILAASAPRGAVGSEGEITATVMAAGAPLRDVEVELKIISGPHAGATSRQRTNESGNAKFLYRGASKGTDLLVAVVNMSGTTVAGSNVVLYEWTEEVRAFIAIEPGVCPATVDARMQDAVTVALLGTTHFNVSDVDAASLHLENAAPIRMHNQDLSQPGEGADCPCSREGSDGMEDLVMFFRIQDVFPDIAGITAAQTREVTLSGRFKSGSSFEATNCVVVSSSPKTTTLENILVPTEEGLEDSDG